MLHLEFPNISHEKSYLEMIEEWKNHETPTSPWALFRGDTFESFLETVTQDRTSNYFWVPATLFFFMEDNALLWALHIRHHIDHPNLRETGGHIGYGLRPSARGKWLAREMLTLGLEKTRKLGLDRVLLTADEDNPASWKTIEACWWVFERTAEKDGRTLRRYWITL